MNPVGSGMHDLVVPDGQVMSSHWIWITCVVHTSPPEQDPPGPQLGHQFDGVRVQAPLKQ
jgi:hypothetical protein